MKKILILIAIILSAFIQLKGQSNLNTHFTFRNSVATSRYFPANQENADYKFELSSNYNLWVANKTLTYSTLSDIYNANRLTSSDVSSIIDQMEKDNRLGIGQDFLILGFGLKTLIKNHTVFWNFTISDRLNANALVPKALVQLAWQGNRQFVGETVDLGNTTIIGTYFRDYGVGASTTLKQWDNWKINLGARLNYYQGLAGINRSNDEFLFTTADQVDYIEINANINYKYTGFNDFNFINTTGHGFGVNMGASVEFRDRFKFDLALSDLGFISFKKDVYSLESVHDYRFYGANFDNIINPDDFLDTLEFILTPKLDSLSSNKFKASIGTKLLFMGSIKLGKLADLRKPITLFFYYSQGFSEKPGSTKYPEFSFGIHRPIFRHFMFSANVTYGGFNHFSVGGLLGVHFKHYSVALHSDNITGGIYPNRATGAALGLMVKFQF